MKNNKEIEALLDRRAKKNDVLVSKYKRLIEESEADATAKKQKLESLPDTASYSEISRATESFNAAASTSAFYKDKLDHLQTDPVYTPEEAEDLLRRIKAGFIEEEDKMMDSIDRQFEEIGKQLDEFKTAYEESKALYCRVEFEFQKLTESRSWVDISSHKWGRYYDLKGYHTNIKRMTGRD